MTVYNWLCLFGIPALIASGVGYLIKKVKETGAQTRALESGVQALLRAQMIADYNHYAAKGYAPIYARENFENCYRQYHALGGNGVMDDLHRKFIDLKTGEEKHDD